MTTYIRDLISKRKHDVELSQPVGAPGVDGTAQQSVSSPTVFQPNASGDQPVTSKTTPRVLWSQTYAITPQGSKLMPSTIKSKPTSKPSKPTGRLVHIVMLFASARPSGSKACINIFVR